MVVDCKGIVVGLLRNQSLDTTTAEQMMESGPTTVRPGSLLQTLYDQMAERDTKLVLVTAPQGDLNGAVLREDAERLLGGESPEQIWRDCSGCPGRWTTKTWVGCPPIPPTTPIRGFCTTPIG